MIEATFFAFDKNKDYALDLMEFSELAIVALGRIDAGLKDFGEAQRVFQLSDLNKNEKLSKTGEEKFGKLFLFKLILNFFFRICEIAAEQREFKEALKILFIFILKIYHFGYKTRFRSNKVVLKIKKFFFQVFTFIS